jgi:hypothetical protein
VSQVGGLDQRVSQPFATTLLCKPFTKSLLNFFLRNSTLRLSRILAIPNLFDDIQVVLNVFERAIIWQLAQK